MNATRRFAKKSAGVLKFTYDQGKASFTQNVIQGIAILVLIVYSAVLIRYVPQKFLNFFEHLAVKIVFLVIIGFVGLYSPAVALFLAIALICTLQMAQKKKIMTDISEMDKAKAMGQKVMNDMNRFKQNMMQTIGSDNSLFESMDNRDSTSGQDYLDPMIIEQEANNVETLENMAPSSDGQPSDEYLPPKDEPSQGGEGPKGYNNDASCLPCNKDSSDNALNSQCGYVQTWKNQFSAQGLGMDITGYQGSVGYPV